LLSIWGKPGILLSKCNQPSSLAVHSRSDISVADDYNDRGHQFSRTGRALWATSGLHPVRA
jgi:hypothetical protein